MSKNKLAGIIVACTIAIIAVIVLLHYQPWNGSLPTETYTLTTIVSPSGAGSVSPSGGEYESGDIITISNFGASIALGTFAVIGHCCFYCYGITATVRVQCICSILFELDSGYKWRYPIRFIPRESLSGCYNRARGTLEAILSG